MNTLRQNTMPSRGRSGVSTLILIIGLLIWTAAQGYLTSAPLWTRDLPPEADDSLAYLVRTAEIQECLHQDCPALQDLRQQQQIGMSDPNAARQRDIAGFPFPFYHPGFSLVILGISKLGVDLTTSYKIFWSVSPLLFGISFACLLSVLWGRQAAGVALCLLAFKIFPDTGLHYLTPSNFAMSIALLVWARIIARQGDAPWTLVLGTVVLCAIHPLGEIYSLMGLLLALLMPGAVNRKRTRLTILGILVVSFAVLFWASFIRKPALVNVLSVLGPFPGILESVKGIGYNLFGAAAEIVTLKDGLFGSFALFFLAVAFGFFTASKQSRALATRLLCIFIPFLAASFYFTNPMSPSADIFFRIWIPAVAILFGAIASGICFVFRESRRLWVVRLQRAGNITVAGIWPVLALALLIGYSFDMTLSGAEQLQTTAEFMTDRQPLSFDPLQPRELLSTAKSGDRVLYTSTIAMAYYFLHGAMDFGAVYYHPSFVGTEAESRWLSRQDLRFAVAYHPSVYHPTLEGLDEKDRCISTPEYRFSPLSTRRKHGPISREGFIPASDFKWIDIDLKNGASSSDFFILLKNSGDAADLEIVPLDINGSPITGKMKLTAPARWSGKVRLDQAAGNNPQKLRVLLPPGRQRILIYGMGFCEDGLHWPWKQKTSVTFEARSPETGTVRLSFDPADLMPAALKARKIEVLADKGSSVLMRIGE